MFTLPHLKYKHADLEPIISAKTIEYHYGKHLQTYINNLNKLIETTNLKDASLDEIIKKSDGAVFNNAAQTYNHILYFESLTPKHLIDKEINTIHEGDLKNAIESKWNSVEDFIKEFSDTALGIFGSGWAWLSKDINNKLVITTESNAGNPLTSNLTPLFTIDIWEHAYYLDYQNRRGEYIKELWQIVDWQEIENRFKK